METDIDQVTVDWLVEALGASRVVALPTPLGDGPLAWLALRATVARLVGAPARGATMTRDRVLTVDDAVP